MSLLVIVPIGVIFLSSFNVNSSTWSHILEYLFFQYSYNTIVLLLGVCSLTFLLGILAAWIVSFYYLPFRKLISLLLIMPIAIPPYALAYCYADISDYSFMITSSSNFYFIKTVLSFLPSIRSPLGAIIILSLTLFPYVYLICKNSFINNSKSIIEAAANLGANRYQLFFRFAIPISRPAIIAGITLVIMETLADFGVVHYLGINTLSVGIYKAWFGLDDINSSTRIASILFLFSFFFIFTERLTRKGKSQRYISYGKGNNILLFQEKKLLPVFFIFFLLLLSLVLPIAWLLYNALQSDIILTKELYISAFNSLKVGLVGASVIVISASIVCFYNRAYKKSSSLFLNIAKVGYASPGIVIAIGVMIPIIYIDKKLKKLFEYFGYDIGLFLSGSIFILIVAYLVRFLSLAINPIESAYERVSNRFDFVAENLKATKGKLLLKIHVPMIFYGLIIAFLLLFIDILKELPATLILRPLNFNTLSIQTFEFASSEQLSMAALPALLITGLAVLPLICIFIIFNKIEKDI